jgi:RNA polymerase sigma factor (sigma-70 family)
MIRYGYNYIRKVLAGDTEAFSYFITTYKHMAFSIALSVLKEEFLAEEAVQNAFITTFRKLDRFHQQSKFSTWFYRIVTNEALMLLRKARREPLDFTSDYNDDIADDSPDLFTHETDKQHLVNEGLKLLPPNESLVLRLFYLEDESIKEVCEITGWTAAHVKVTLHRARKRLFTVLNEIANNKLPDYES